MKIEIPMLTLRYISLQGRSFQQVSSKMQELKCKPLPKNAYTLRETLFEKMDGLNIE